MKERQSDKQKKVRLLLRNLLVLLLVIIGVLNALSESFGMAAFSFYIALMMHIIM